jgi:DNA-binding Lrp family transcriptional regulator
MTSHGEIDELDGRLIALLRDEPRLGLMEAARRLQVARGTVQARLAKLEERGVIRGHGPRSIRSAWGTPCWPSSSCRSRRGG